MKLPRALAALTVLLALVLIPSPSAGQASKGVPADAAITFAVDHENRTITITVRLAFFGIGCPEKNLLCGDEAVESMARVLANQILSDWSGHTYKCYDVIFKIQAARVSGPAGRRDWVEIGLDFSPAAFIHIFTTHGGLPVNYPGTGAGSWPASEHARNRALVSNSFGFILGLEAGEARAPRRPRGVEGGLGLVDKSIIAKIVGRSGQVKVDELQCDYKVDYKTVWRYEGVKCDGPSGVWEIDISARKVSGTVSIRLDADTLAGPVETVYAGGGASYRLSGTGRFIEGDPPKLFIDHGSGTATVRGRSSGATGGKVTIPLKYGDCEEN